MSPIYIEWALICHCSGDPASEIARRYPDCPMYSEVMEWLFDNGLIESRVHPRGTDKLAAWVDMICATPLPVAKWVAA
jgi:hypothetical protein